ncbi:MAG TPA: CRTAC1 family protein [Terriglobia bacterium]|nr:CRTAC1 family protein [Terriglobia bacterium]
MGHLPNPRFHLPLGRRAFLRDSLGGLCFAVPIFGGGRLGQPVLSPNPWYVDVARQSGLAAFRETCGSLAKNYLVETFGSGVALFDYNNDGLLDVFLVNGSSYQALDNPRLPRTSSRLFRNNGDGSFTDVTEVSGLLNQGWGLGVAVADFDNDGHPDVFITNFGENALFHNRGDGTFQDVTREAGVEGGKCSTGCAWGDYDGDGRLDLYVARYADFDRSRVPLPQMANYCVYLGVPVACGPRGLQGLSDLVYHNEGNGKFREVSAEVGIRDTEKRYGFQVVWFDFDNDGRLDAFVANDSSANYLWRNLGNGTFEEVAFEAGCAVSGDGREQSSMGVAVGDYDNDGWFDLYVTNFSEDYNTLYHNNRGVFEDVTYTVGLGTVSYSQLSWGAGFVDVNNDGWRDIFVANGHIYPQAGQAGNSYYQTNQLLRNLKNGRFAEISQGECGFADARSSRGAAFGDLTGNGRMDIIVNNIDDVPFHYSSSRKIKANWVRIKLAGTKCNRDAIGARVEVAAGGLTQADVVMAGGSFLSTSDVRLHFGLGDALRIDSVKIRWPDGSTQSHLNLIPNREYRFQQGNQS